MFALHTSSRLAVGGAQVERGDRRLLAAAAARRRALEPRADRPAERVGLGMALGALDHRAQPARRRSRSSSTSAISSDSAAASPRCERRSARAESWRIARTPARSITSGVRSREPSSTTITSYGRSMSWAASDDRVTSR